MKSPPGMHIYTLNNALLALIITWLLFLTVQQRLPLPGSSLNVRSTDAREIRAAPTSSASPAPMVGDNRQPWRFPPSTTFLEGLRGCETLDCVRDAHALPHGDARYNFPHFMIAGYSKSATTSLYSYLTRHPDIIKPSVKESNFLTGSCQIQGYRLDCKPGSTLAYLNDMRISSFSTWKVKGQRASFDATPKVFDLGAQGLPQILREKMPWLKLVVSYREPISRSISKHVMLWDKNQTLAQGDPVCMNQPGHDLAFCLEHDKNPIMGVPRDSYYSHPLQYWLDAFPAEQIHVVQYENLVAVGERQAAELRRLKAFLEIDMDAISDELVSEFNCRSCTIEPEGHVLPEALYQSLVQEARRDTKRLAYLLEKHGLVDSSKAWMQNWGNLWNENLRTCSDGFCKVKLS